MDDQPQPTPYMPDPTELSRTLAGISVRSQRLLVNSMRRQIVPGASPEADPLNVGKAFIQMTVQMMANPVHMVKSNLNLWQDYLTLWNNSTQRMLAQDTAPIIEPTPDDRRFHDDAWNENRIFDFFKQFYLLTSRRIQSSVNGVEGLDKKTAGKVDFYTRQLLDALSPSNFPMTNPKVLRTTLGSGGKNLLQGLENLLKDLEEGDGRMKIKMVDPDAFEVGVDVATTPGKVIFRNDLMELLQFNPTTEDVVKTPLVIVPPWINKYYILDLRKKNSFIRWAVERGHSVFVVSWVNPDAGLAQKTFDDYMLEGPIAAIDAAKKATSVDSVNMIGYCIGGTLVASALAYLTAKDDVDQVNSVTFFATMVDFEEPGDLGVFIDESQLTSLEKKMTERGYLEGDEMATTFNMLRSNDLIWSFVINNYLMGKEPFPLDLFSWNADATRMPAAMHSFYLRKMYLENKLVEPGGIELAGIKLDLRDIKVPTYIISAREDHIAPWKSTYRATHLFKGPVKFVLAGSGHIAGIVNHPSRPKYGYWTNAKKAKTAADWFNGATQHEGSWWPDWDSWLKKQSDKNRVPARVPGEGGLETLADAPGTYIMMKAAD